MLSDSIVFSMRTSILCGSIRHPCDIKWGNGGKTIHNDPFGRLYYVHAGQAVVVHHGRMFHLQPGHLFAIPAHVPGRYRCPTGMDLTFVHFTAEVFGSIDPFSALGWPLVVKALAIDVHRLERIIRLWQRSSPAALLEADGLLRQLLARFATQADTGNAPTLARLSRLQPVLLFIERNLRQKLTLADLAAIAYLQPTYFSNLFTKLMGVSPMYYVNRLRVEKAAGLLFTGEESIEAIATAVGFGDVYYFSRTFKRFMGLPPTRYRLQIRADA